MIDKGQRRIRIFTKNKYRIDLVKSACVKMLTEKQYPYSIRMEKPKYYPIAKEPAACFILQGHLL